MDKADLGNDAKGTLIGMQDFVLLDVHEMDSKHQGVRLSTDSTTVDVQDVLDIICKSKGAAYVMRHSRFKCSNTSKVLWKGSSRKRLVCSINFMIQTLKKLRHMKFVKEFVAKLELHEEGHGVRYVYEHAEINATSADNLQNTSQDLDEDSATIYSIIYKPTGQPVYVGRTKDPHRRLHEHASKVSKCRLVKNAFLKHGRSSFTLEPIMRCSIGDADANESYWIVKKNTLYPNGYNLRHGSKAGEETASLAIVPLCTSVIGFTGVSDEARACAEAWTDIAEIVESVEDEDRIQEAQRLCKDMIRNAHPDKNHRSFSSADVCVMLNTIRDSLS